MKNTFNFPDAYLPADVIKAVLNRNVTLSGFMVLMVVRALTIKKTWSWARNEYFADACKRSESEVSRCIQTLVNQGYLKKKWKNGRRFLKLAWSWSLRKTANRFAENRKSKMSKTAKGNCGKPQALNKGKETKENKHLRGYAAPGENGRSDLFSGQPDPAKKRRWNWTTGVMVYKEGKRNGRVLEKPDFRTEASAFADLEKKIAERDGEGTDAAREYIGKIIKDHLAHQGESLQPKADNSWEINRKFVPIEDAYKRRRDLLKKEIIHQEDAVRD